MFFGITQIKTAKGGYGPRNWKWRAVDGITQLANVFKLQKLPKLRILYLDFNDIRDNGVHQLIQSFQDGALQNLVELHLVGNKITNDGISKLKNAVISGSLPLLEELSLFGNLNYDNNSFREILHRPTSQPVKVIFEIDYPDLTS